MKKSRLFPPFLISIPLLLLPMVLMGQGSFYLDDNGVTIRCPGAEPGETGTVNGVEYEAVDRNLLILRRDEGADLSRVCTTPVINMRRMFSRLDHIIFKEAASSDAINGSVNTGNEADEGRLSTDEIDFNPNIGSWDVSNVTNMERMFEENNFFNRDISKWDVGNVTSMHGMFDNHSNFNNNFIGSPFNQDIGDWDVSNVTDMSYMFEAAVDFNQDIGDWDVSSVENMSGMFRNASSFNQNIGGWNVSSVSGMISMFWGAGSFNQNLSGWCVSHIPSEPANFSTDSPLQPNYKPIWGTCPDKAWQLEIAAGIMNFTASAKIGAHYLATDGFDEDFDTPAPPAPPGDHIRAVFHHPDWNHPAGDDFITDIRALRDLSEVPLEWILIVTSPVTGQATLQIHRPHGFTLPIAAYDGDQWTVSREGDLLIEFGHDGEKSREFIIQVGDTTAPALTAGDAFEGPAIWSSAVSRAFTWQASDAHHLELVILEHSSNNGESWDTLFVGLDDRFDWHPADLRFNEENRFRLTALDRAGNAASYTTKTPITIASEVQPLPFEQGWNLVGAPFLSMNKTIQTLAPAHRFEWDGASYREFTGYTSGKGYWIGALEAGTDTLYGTIAGDAVEVDALQGWSMISSPLMRTVYLDSIVVINLKTKQSLSYAQALDQQWISAPLAYRDDSYVSTPEFKPFDGYWLGVQIKSVRLKLPIHKYAGPDDVPDDLDDLNNIRLLAQEPPQNRIALLVSSEGIQQTLVLGDQQLRTIPAPPAVPNSPRLGFSGTPTVLGDLYLQLGMNVDEQKSIPLYRSDDSKELDLTWEDQPWDEIKAKMVLSNGMQYNMLEAGSLVIEPGEVMPVILISPESVSADEPETHPAAYKLYQNYPNPFNPSTQIRFALPEQNHVILSVYNLLGQRIATLVDETRSAGWQDVTFDAGGLTSGLYIYRLQTDGYVETRQMMFVK